MIKNQWHISMLITAIILYAYLIKLVLNDWAHNVVNLYMISIYLNNIFSLRKHSNMTIFHKYINFSDTKIVSLINNMTTSLSLPYNFTGTFQQFPTSSDFDYPNMFVNYYWKRLPRWIESLHLDRVRIYVFLFSTKDNSSEHTSYSILTSITLWCNSSDWRTWPSSSAEGFSLHAFSWFANILWLGFSHGILVISVTAEKPTFHVSESFLET